MHIGVWRYTRIFDVGVVNRHMKTPNLSLAAISIAALEFSSASVLTEEFVASFERLPRREDLDCYA